MPTISYRYATLAAATLLSTACFTQLRTPDGGADAPVVDVPTSLADVGPDAGPTDVPTDVPTMADREPVPTDEPTPGPDVIDVPAVPDVPNVDVPNVVCPMGMESVGGRCLVVGVAPRPISPISLGDVSLRRPTLRWELRGGFEGAVVDLCRDRACTMVIESIRAMGTSARPTMALPARSVVYWRLRGTVGVGTSNTASPTWLFHVPAVDNTGGIDSSARAHLDLNGDGYDDVVAGAPSATGDVVVQAGTASVFYGSAMGVPMNPDIVLNGSARGDEFGQSVASAGDVNGDGYGDLIVGAWRADPGGRVDGGTASVYYGGAMGIGRAPAIVLEGVAASDRFGRSVASAGDVNGDGYGDVIIGNYAAPPGGPNGTASASIFHGSAMGLPAVASLILSGGPAAENFGAAVASAGDVNGDGYSDVIVGAFYATVGAMNNIGTASIYHGGMAGVGAAANRTLNGFFVFGYFGRSVASAGDVNNDGYSDVIVGAEQSGPGGRATAGVAAVYHGSAMGVAMNQAIALAGVAAGDYFGVSVSSAGDVNGDGFSDVVVGAYDASPMGRSHAGTASVFQGSAMGIPMAPTVVLEGASAETRLGWSVAGAGDINKDGYSDLIIGAQSGSPGGRPNAGIASIFHGAMAGVSVMPVRVLEGVAVADFFGFAVASLDRNPRRVMHRGGFLRSLFN